MPVVRFLLLLVLSTGFSALTIADTVPENFLESVSLSTVKKIFPEAQTMDVPSGRPSAVRVYGEAELEGFLTTIGYVFSVGDLVKTAGYAGEPFEIISAVNMDGFITGALLAKHQEPVQSNLLTDLSLLQTVESFSGLDVLDPGPRDFNAYAEYRDSSALIMLEAVYKAGRLIATSRELQGPGEREGRLLDIEMYRPLSWKQLLNMGAVRRVTLIDTHILFSPALSVGSPETDSNNRERIYVALATPALIGRNLLAKEDYSVFDGGEKNSSSGNSIWVGAEGSFISSEMDLALRGRDDALLELRIRQGGWVKTIRNSETKDIKPLVPSSISRAWLIQIVETADFDPTQPWSIEIKTQGEGSSFDVLSIPYFPPQEVILEPIPHQVAVSHRKQEVVIPLWVTVWVDRRYALGIMFVSLLVLAMILILQGALARSPKVLNRIKTGFLLFTLIWLGWYAGAQVSIMHILSLVRAPVLGWSLESWLLHPLTLLILGFTLVGTLLLGRGVFCGWLCPFGALQDLLNDFAKWLRVQQLSVPHWMNSRLWSLKYFVLIGLLSVALFSPSNLNSAVEIEPFSTSILFYFMRPWPYTLFAIFVLLTSLFIERSFCRYLCPLGAGLAVAGRLRVLEWLKRRPECGDGCNICGDLCPVQAIGFDGQINFNECYQCLKCQVAFYDDTLCPPLVQRRIRRERLEVV